MIKILYQNDIDNLQIQKSGCYLMSIIFLAFEKIKKNMKKDEIIEIYKECLEKNLINVNCYVFEPLKIFNLIFNKFKSNFECILFNKIFQDDLNNTIYTDYIASVRAYNVPSHFIVIDKNKNIIYDPDILLKQKAMKYDFINYRGFKIEKR